MLADRFLRVFGSPDHVFIFSGCIILPTFFEASTSFLRKVSS